MFIEPVTTDLENIEKEVGEPLWRNRLYVGQHSSNEAGLFSESGKGENKVWLNRYLCDVIEEARVCVKTLNFSYLSSLLEEIQVMGNRMEAKLSDIKDFEKFDEEVSDLKKEVKKLKKEIKKLEIEKGEKNGRNV